MKVRIATALLASITVAALGAGAGTTAGSTDVRKGHRLTRFGSCAELVAYAKRHTRPLVGPWGLGGPPIMPVFAPLPPGAKKEGVDFSGTNVQETAVDEPDLVKTDGEHLFTIGEGKLQAIAVGAHPRHLDSLPLRVGDGHELFLYGDRVIVLSRGASDFYPLRMGLGYVPYSTKTILTEVDASDPSFLRVVSRLELDGGYASARLVGGTMRVVLVSQMPHALEFRAPRPNETPAQATARNRRIVSRSRVANWLPRRVRTNIRTKTRDRRALVGCTNVRRPPSFSGPGMVTVLTADLDRGLQVVDSDAVLADGQIVYSSTKGLYVATQRWSDDPDDSGVTTALHKFDVSEAGRTEYRGSGAVSGFLVNQWAMDEHDGRLRVASTSAPSWWGAPAGRDAESFVTVLEEDRGKLVQVGRVGGLGKGEQIYAVRFMDDVGYVVTFRQVDPLYTLDLSSPRNPRVLGELKIRGYSSYLHPIGGDLLLGIGQDATGQGRVLGTQLSVFDVSDLRRPVRLHRRTIGGSSEAEYDHHAFLHWPRTGLTVVPVERGALGFRVGRSGIDQVGRVTHPSSADFDSIRRSTVVGDGLYTVSSEGVKASALATLEPRAWIAFR